MLKLTIYHCYFCGIDFGLTEVFSNPSCPCCRNEDDLQPMTEINQLWSAALKRFK